MIVSLELAKVGRCQTYFLLKNGSLAQLGEHLPYKQEVGGSIPSTPTIFADLAQSGRATDL